MSNKDVRENNDFHNQGRGTGCCLFGFIDLLMELFGKLFGG